MTRHRRYLEARAVARSNGPSALIPAPDAVPDRFRLWMPGLDSLSPEQAAHFHEGAAEDFTPMSPVALTGRQEGKSIPAQAPGDDAQVEHLQQQARKQADRMLEQARQAADQLQAEAQQHLEQMLAERARQVAEAVRREQEQSFQVAAAELLQSFQQAADEALQGLSGQVAELAAAVTSKIIHRKVRADDAIVLDVISEAMTRLSDCKRLRVVISPEDESMVAAHRELLLKQAAGLEQLQMVSSDGVERGGCLLDSDGGEVDARISSQLEVIWKQLLGTETVSQTA